MSIWIRSVILPRCLQGLTTKLPCKGSRAGSAAGRIVIALAAWRARALAAWRARALGVGSFLGAAGLPFLIARRPR